MTGLRLNKNLNFELGFLRCLQETFRVSGVDDFSAHVPTGVVNVSCISANVYFLHSGPNNGFILETSSNLFQCLMVLFVFGVANDAYTWGPSRLFRAEEILIDGIFNILYDAVNALTDLLWGGTLIVLLVLGVVHLAVSYWSQFYISAKEIGCSELAWISVGSSWGVSWSIKLLLFVLL